MLHTFFLRNNCYFCRGLKIKNNRLFIFLNYCFLNYCFTIQSGNINITQFIQRYVMSKESYTKI